MGIQFEQLSKFEQLASDVSDMLLSSKLDKEYYQENKEKLKKLYRELIKEAPRYRAILGGELMALDGLPEGIVI